MNRHTVKMLQSIRAYPSVSILLPTHRTSPENRQDPLRVKNLVNQATERLLSEFTKREMAPLLARLDDLVSKIDYKYALDGLALYVNQDVGYQVYLPFTVRERVIIDETFATRDLVYALHHGSRYWVLVLSEKPTRLYVGSRANLIEVTDAGFPIEHKLPGGATRLPGGVGVDRSAYRDERHRQFFRQVDAEFSKLQADDTLPLVVTGVDRFLSFFREISSNTGAIVGTVSGSYDKATPHELAQRVWPLMQEVIDQQRHAILEELELAVRQQKYASGIGEVWRAVQDGRGATLVVEEDFDVPARIDPTGRHLTIADNSTDPDVVDDAVDEAIEAVIAMGGKVVFVESGALAVHQRIALITRY